MNDIEFNTDIEDYCDPAGRPLGTTMAVQVLLDSDAVVDAAVLTLIVPCGWPDPAIVSLKGALPSIRGLLVHSADGCDTSTIESRLFGNISTLPGCSANSCGVAASCTLATVLADDSPATISDGRVPLQSPKCSCDPPNVVSLPEAPETAPYTAGCLTQRFGKPIDVTAGARSNSVVLRLVSLYSAPLRVKLKV